MGIKNTSDSIEEYIKTILAQAGMVELKRSELADVFQVVPSQINYVIKTRFTESRGYIRIGKIEFSDRHQMLSDLLANVGESLSQPVFSDILQLLFDEKIISQREGDLLLASASDAILGAEAPRIRARMLRKILQQLDRKGN